MTACRVCGVEVHEGQAYCHHCGQPLQAHGGQMPPPPPPPHPMAPQPRRSSGTSIALIALIVIIAGMCLLGTAAVAGFYWYRMQGGVPPIPTLPSGGKVSTVEEAEPEHELGREPLEPSPELAEETVIRIFGDCVTRVEEFDPNTGDAVVWMGPPESEWDTIVYLEWNRDTEEYGIVETQPFPPVGEGL